MTPQRTARRMGWTLVELLITLAVVGVILAWAVPGLWRLSLRSQLVTTTNSFARGLHLARETAIMQGRDTTFCAGDAVTGCVGAAGAHGWIVFIDRDRDGQPGDGEHVVAVAVVASGLHISGNGPFRKAVEFTPMGNAQWPSGAFAAGRLRICAAVDLSPNSTELVLAASGRVRTSHRSLDGACPGL